MSKAALLPRFESFHYYKVEKDASIVDEKYQPVAKIRPEGTKLIIKYYADKYQTRISRPADVDDEKLATLSIDDRDKRYLADWEFFNDERGLLKGARQIEAKEYREAFIVGPGIHHNIPIVYLREGKEEGLLYANTLSDHTKGVLDRIKVLSQNQNLDIYVVEEGRQAGSYGCSVDALFFAKEATAIEKGTGQYRIPNLLSRLKVRSQKKDNYYSVLLLDEFLVDSQISKTVKVHQEKYPRIIRKKRQETLEKIRKRFTFKNVRMLNGVVSDISSYLKIKGFKYMVIIEIQFYIEKIKEKWLFLWNDQIRITFIEQAKIVASKSQENLYDFAGEFLNQLIEFSQSVSELKSEGSVNFSFFSAPAMRRQQEELKQNLLENSQPKKENCCCIIL